LLDLLFMEFKSDGARQHYFDTGRSAGIPEEDVIVFIHGFPHDHRLWDGQVEAFKSRFRVVTYDVRGFGKSEAGDGLFLIDFFVEDFIALLDHLHIRRAIVCGLSMGGYVALRAIELHPERFRALVLCDTASKADTNAAKKKRADSIRTLRQKGLEAFIDEYADGVFLPENLRGHPELLERFRKMVGGNSPRSIGAGFIAMAARPDTTDSLRLIRVPTLVVAGEKDPILSATLEMQRKIPGSKLKIIPHAGHLSNLEAPEAFNSRLEKFLDGLAPRRRPQPPQKSAGRATDARIAPRTAPNAAPTSTSER
jgi:pimeloyl-ACP methyl ester carboxylesterase